MTTIIKNGTVVTADLTYRADVKVDGGKIVEIGENLKGGNELDATGCYVVPGGIDFTNWWVGGVPEKYHDRAFYQYNQEILLMRTNQVESTELGKLFAERLSQANGPCLVLIPKRGFSQMTNFDSHDLAGNSIGPWHQPDCDQAFVAALKQSLSPKMIREVDLHINDAEFSAELLSTFMSLMPERN